MAHKGIFIDSAAEIYAPKDTAPSEIPFRTTPDEVAKACAAGVGGNLESAKETLRGQHRARVLNGQDVFARRYQKLKTLSDSIEANIVSVNAELVEMLEESNRIEGLISDRAQARAILHSTRAALESAKSVLASPDAHKREGTELIKLEYSVKCLPAEIAALENKIETLSSEIATATKESGIDLDKLRSRMSERAGKDPKTGVIADPNLHHLSQRGLLAD